MPMLKATFNMWESSNGVLNDDVDEREVESIQHVESDAGGTRGKLRMARNGACTTRADRSA
jgi:hypothetical protein